MTLLHFDGQRLYTAAEVGEAQAQEAELVSAPLRRRIAELERERDEERRTRYVTEGVLDRLVEDLEKALEHWDWWARAYGRDPAPSSRDKKLLCEKHIYDINQALGREG